MIYVEMYKGNENSEIAEYIWYKNFGSTAFDILHANEIHDSSRRLMCVIILKKANFPSD